MSSLRRSLSLALLTAACGVDAAVSSDPDAPDTPVGGSAGYGDPGGGATPEEVERPADAEGADVVTADVDSPDEGDAVHADAGSPDESAVDAEAPPPQPDAALEVPPPPPPEAAGGSGVRYAGEAEPGVRCRGEVCAEGQLCCFGVASGCSPDFDQCIWATVQCDGPEDCPGQVCCYEQFSSGANRSSVCRDVGACEVEVACNTDADCGDGACVRGWTNHGAVDVGVCQAGPSADCSISSDSNCPDVDWHGADLTGVDLTNAHLGGADLSGVRLNGAPADGLVLAGGSLERASVSAVSMTEADLSGARLAESNFNNVVLEGLIAPGSDFSHANFMNCPFDGADLTDADLRGTQFMRSSLRGVDLTGADLTGTTLLHVDLTGAHIEAGQLSHLSFGLDIICPDGSHTESADDGESPCGD